MLRKIILIVFAVTSLIFYGTSAFALISFSGGVPLSHTFTGKWSDGRGINSDGVSGSFIQIGVPIYPGIVIDNYKTKIKDPDIGIDLETTIYNLYYLLPIPTINLTVGLGIGSTELKCGTCSEFFNKGKANQWYASLGMPIVPLFDLHLSYRSVSTKIKYKSGTEYEGKENDFGGSVIGLGIMFNF